MSAEDFERCAREGVRLAGIDLNAPRPSEERVSTSTEYPICTRLSSGYRMVRWSSERWAQIPPDFEGSEIPDEFIFNPEWNRDFVNAWWKDGANCAASPSVPSEGSEEIEKSLTALIDKSKSIEDVGVMQSILAAFRAHDERVAELERERDEYDDASGEAIRGILVTAQAEIQRLTSERDDWKHKHDCLDRIERQSYNQASDLLTENERLTSELEHWKNRQASSQAVADEYESQNDSLRSELAQLKTQPTSDEWEKAVDRFHIAAQKLNIAPDLARNAVTRQAITIEYAAARSSLDSIRQRYEAQIAELKEAVSAEQSKAIDRGVEKINALEAQNRRLQNEVLGYQDGWERDKRIIAALREDAELFRTVEKYLRIFGSHLNGYYYLTLEANGGKPCLHTTAEHIQPRDFLKAMAEQSTTLTEKEPKSE